MKVLVTGSRGQVGSALVRRAPADHQVIALDHAALDITDKAAVDALVRGEHPDLIVNAAAYTAVDQAESEPDRAQLINESGAAHLARAASNAGARLIHLSTDFVFDGTASTPYSASAAPHPLSIYGETKLSGEKAVLDKTGSAALVLRTAWVYAAEGKNFLLTMLRLMRERGSVRVVADQIGTPTAADSIADAIWALTGLPQRSGIFHWTDAGVASWYDFAVAIAEEALACGLLSRPVTVTPIATEDYPTAATRPRYSVLDTRPTVDAIGIQPDHWRVSLRRVLAEIPRE